MIHFKTGDMLTENAEAMVNTVNCVGVMGRGIALQFKRAFPENYRAYAKACRRGEVRPGSMFVFETGALVNPHLIVNFPTKRHWRNGSRLEDIDAGLVDLARVIREHRVGSIVMPALGSGLGGLNWCEVRPRIELALKDFDELNCVVFEPGEPAGGASVLDSRKVTKMTAGRAALIGLMNHCMTALPDSLITVLDVHKLMYLLQVAGEPLKLRYTKFLHGPYAENLWQVLNSMEGHHLSGYRDGDVKPETALEMFPGAVEDAREVLIHSPATRERVGRVTELVRGFESSSGLELLSTVHWVLEHDKPITIDGLTAQVHARGEQKHKFCPHKIELAASELIRKGWTSRVGLPIQR